MVLMITDLDVVTLWSAEPSSVVVVVVVVAGIVCGNLLGILAE